jgi:hypothetical protein
MNKMDQKRKLPSDTRRKNIVQAVLGLEGYGISKYYIPIVSLCATLVVIILFSIPVDYEPKGKSINNENIVKIEFNDMNGYVEYTVPERCEKVFLKQMRKISRHYNLSQVEPRTYPGYTTKGEKTEQWHDETSIWNIILLEEGEYANTSPPKRGKREIRHIVYTFIFPLRR